MSSAKLHVCVSVRPPQQPNGAEAAVRAGLLTALAQVVPPAAAAAPAGGPGAAAAGAAALPEDWCLRAFGPLARAHDALEFRQPVGKAVRCGLAFHESCAVAVARGQSC